MLGLPALAALGLPAHSEAGEPGASGVLAALTGQEQMDATAILDYFAPLKKWLDEQNQGKPLGW